MFTEYADRWMDTYAKVHLKPGTWQKYANDFRLHLKPTFGMKRLDQITRQDLRDLIAAKREAGLAWNSVRNLICPLRELLNHAVDDGVLATSPATRLGKLNKRPAERSQDTNPFTREELRLYLDTARQYFPHAYPFLLTLARTGLRLGEALALQWDAIDWHGRIPGSPIRLLPYQPTFTDSEEWEDTTGRHEPSTYRDPQDPLDRAEEGHPEEWLG